ncbi:MAG: hypothetical protein JW704_04465 [Anaerolineaceae bacterium]|nr:hypothetical protein [Anaerolineaceae bacterium]MBN2676768.1 hypothetical protein [Anaerolineaceae bacterium]
MPHSTIHRLHQTLLVICFFTFLFTPGVQAATGPVFDYPVNGQSLDYNGAYLFRVLPMENATGYLWGFFQNDILVWENLRDQEQLSTHEYEISTGSPAHANFVPGDLEVWVRAFIDEQYTDATVITIHLVGTPEDDLRVYLPLIRKDLPIINRVPVLVMAYYPPDPANPLFLDPVETGWSGRLISNMQQATQDMVSAGQELISDATRYHGYKDLNAPIYLDYYTYNKIEYFVPMPRGYPLANNQYRPNYNQILSDINICNYVDGYGVKEVWIYGYHASVIVPDESKMSSKYGDISNAWPHDEAIPAQYRLPRCTNSYVMYNFTYQPGGAYAIGNTIHNRMHQLENVIFYAENRGYPPNNSNVIGSLFWDDFSVYGSRASLPGYRASCGNTHSPPNTTMEYMYTSTAFADNNCESWNPNDSQTVYVNANCTQWGCSDTGFYKWFMQNAPGYNNGIVFNGKQMRNWWEAMFDFNQFIDSGRSLYLP